MRNSGKETEMSNLTIAGTKDHPITIGPIAERVRVVWRGRTIGESSRALELREANYPPVVYVRRADIDMSALMRTARVTTCPYKGDANYFSIADGELRDDNAVWTYETPKADVAEIASHLAFYPDKVKITREG
jgi:uncharacterized protein (DUF427 family)